MRFLFLLITFSSFAIAEYSREGCQQLMDHIDDVHNQQMNMPIIEGNPDSTLISYLGMRHRAHDEYMALQESGNGETERASDFRRVMDDFDQKVNNAMSGDNFQRYIRLNKYLAAQYVQSCSEHQDITSTDSNLSYQDVNCFANGYRFGVFEEVKEFGEDVMDAITHYMVNVERDKNFPLSQIREDCEELVSQSMLTNVCRSLSPQTVEPEVAGNGAGREVAGSGGSSGQVAGTSTTSTTRVDPDEEENNEEEVEEYTVAENQCAENQEYVDGACRAKCSDLEIRATAIPHACLPDEAAQRAANLRREESKKKWGKIWRTAGTVALIGGGALLATWALKSIFSSDDSDYNSGYMAGLNARGSSSTPRGGYYYPTQNRSAGMVPYAIPSQYSGGMGYNGMPAWGGFNPYMNMAQPYSAANDFSNYSFSF